MSAPGSPAAPRPPASLLEVRDLRKRFVLGGGALRRPSGWVHAVDGVSFRIERGETLGLVGESGCGKTTVARLLPRLIEPSGGDILFEGESLLGASPARLRRLRPRIQLVFQESTGALDPRKTVEDSVGEGLVLAGARTRKARIDRIVDALARTGLEPGEHLGRFPHELSGGERQRVGIARAIVVDPSVLVCDEVVSSLDASTAGQILDLLDALQRDRGHGCLFISHDLSTVRRVSHRVAVMYLGRIVESGPADRLLREPHHPYTRALLDAWPAEHPSGRKEGRGPRGEVPSAIAPPPGCRFHPRCPRVMERCRREDPPGAEQGPGHVSWCFLERERDRG